MSIRRFAIGFLRDINLCEWSNGDHRVSFCVVIFSSFGWNSVAITWVKVSLRHVFCVITKKVSRRLISANDVRALHCKSVVIYVFFRSSNAELRASFPDDLGEVACAAWKFPVVEVIARMADLIVPITVIVICERFISGTKTYSDYQNSLISPLFRGLSTSGLLISSLIFGFTTFSSIPNVLVLKKSLGPVLYSIRKWRALASSLSIAVEKFLNAINVRGRIDLPKQHVFSFVIKEDVVYKWIVNLANPPNKLSSTKWPILYRRKLQSY